MVNFKEYQAALHVVSNVRKVSSDPDVAPEYMDDVERSIYERSLDIIQQYRNQMAQLKKLENQR